MSDAPKIKAKDDGKQAVKSVVARLMAVQALYQNHHNQQSASELLADFLYKRAGMEIDGEEMVKPDGALLKAILDGVGRRMDDIGPAIDGAMSGNKSSFHDVEPLLKAILMCGTFELLEHSDIDSPIIINDYLNIGHAFYEKNEVSFINGILDNLKKNIRS